MPRVFNWYDEETPKTYPLLKSSTSFTQKREFKPLDKGYSTRTVTLIHKNKKKNSQRHKSDWYNIHTISPFINKERFMRVNILAGEIFRLIDINQSPKYRYLQNDADYDLISKGINHPIEFHQYFYENDEEEDKEASLDISVESIKQFFSKNSLEENDLKSKNTDNEKILEGTMRQCFLKYFLGENDLKFSNLYLDKQQRYLYAIDHGQCFAPYIFNLYDLNKEAADVLAQNSYTLTLADFESFPIVTTYSSSNFEFHEKNSSPFLKSVYSPLLAKTLKKEKFSTAFKLLILENYLQKMISFHITSQEDVNGLSELLSKRQQELSSICSESKEFVGYIEQYRGQLFKMLLFELNEFQLDNRHYKLFRFNDIIDKLEIFLKNLKLPPLSLSEKQSLNLFCEKIKKDDIETLKEIRNFYSLQGFSAYKRIVDKKLNKLLAKPFPFKAIGVGVGIAALTAYSPVAGLLFGGVVLGKKLKDECCQSRKSTQLKKS